MRTESEGKPVDYLSVFNPNLNDGSISGDKNKYPYLQLVDFMTVENNSTLEGFHNGKKIESR
ncbi:hypothetical protein [Clostridium sp.]|uniref:hypothetical protein n=1 Tax=Clostridium sp. TaxID=1506 RepID=UPI0025C3A693|nr:hypothetical protein [Clostridium sp.]